MATPQVRRIAAVLTLLLAASEPVPLEKPEDTGLDEGTCATEMSVNLLQSPLERLSISVVDLADQRQNSSSDANLDVDRANLTEEVGLDLVGGTRIFSEALASQVEYELNQNVTTSGAKNKILIAVFELLGLGLCGIDRCYMGQTCIGVVKGLTLGGLGVWALLDYFAVIITCLSQHEYINALGIKGTFTQNTIMPAFIIVVVVLSLKCCASCIGAACGFLLLKAGIAPPEEAEADDK